MNKDLLEDIKIELPEHSVLIEILKKIDTSTVDELIIELETAEKLITNIDNDDKKDKKN